MAKTFILDTNVILHDYNSIMKFEENDVIIPIVVLEELDNFKKGNEEINFNAREFMRELDKLAGDSLFNGGVSLGEGKGTLKIELGKEFSEKMKLSFTENKPDHQILAVADYYHRTYPDKNVALVSKDINLRMKAKSLGINAEDYQTDKVRNVEELYKEIHVHENIDDALVSRLFQEKEGIPVEEFKFEHEPAINSFFILKGGASSALAKYNHIEKTVTKVSKKNAYNIKPRNAEQTFALEALLDEKIQLISITGKAGTGKTLLALAAALQQRRDFEQIMLARPIVSLSDKDLGYLPGDEKQKIGPYMQPLFDNLTVIKHQFGRQSKDFARIDDLLKDEKLIITPLAYIRGRSLSKVFFIIDEAQNLTPHEVKTIVTRAGEGTKIIFTGDIDQIDSPYLDTKSNGLSYLTDKMKGQDIFAHINLTKGERSYLAELASDLL
ncbi:MAG: PhoH family protein [Bacteroidales bacterium]|nr:PhoH family protein [Bacteroidales bacterium]